jgi:hypothetical protein
MLKDVFICWVAQSVPSGSIFLYTVFAPPPGLFNVYLGVFTLTELFSQDQFLPHPPGPFNLYQGMFILTEFKNQMRPFQSSKQL